mgnify:CR=1 FL=1
MSFKTLRESLQPVIDELQAATDYWSEEYIKTNRGSEHYTKCTKLIEDLKIYILEDERK